MHIPFSVLQDGLCSVHAADAFPHPQERLCVVKVKLTNALGIAARLARVVVLEYFAGFSPGSREVDTQAASNSLVIARGRGGDVTPTCAKKISTDQGGLSQSPPLLILLVFSAR